MGVLVIILKEVIVKKVAIAIIPGKASRHRAYSDEAISKTFFVFRKMQTYPSHSTELRRIASQMTRFFCNSSWHRSAMFFGCGDGARSKKKREAVAPYLWEERKSTAK